jgi:hypothetical protein
MPAKLQFFQAHMGMRLPFGEDYCTIAGIWLLTRIIQAKYCIIAVISFVVNHLVAITKTA